MTTKYQKPPLFDIFTIDELSHRLGLTKRYLIEIEDGRKPANERFMFRACAILNRPEAELFGSKSQE